MIQNYKRGENMTIGEKIKELRLKNDLTQEKLADYLNVSPQAVSKWECGIASPDLALIAPLTKLLHVSADELLGLTVEEVDARKKELEEAFGETWKTGNLKDRYDVCAAAVAEYPGDMKWLKELAWVEAMRSFEYEDNEIYSAEQEKAIKKFARVIEDTDNYETKNSAIMGIVQYLGFRGRNDEAKTYAELYPKDNVDYRYVKEMVLKGDDWVKFTQESLRLYFGKFIEQLGWFCSDDNLRENWADACDVYEKVLEAVFPDGNYLNYHAEASDIHFNRARIYIGAGEYDKAMEELKRARYHIAEYDKIDYVGNTKIYHYTTPLFDRLTLDTGKFYRTYNGSFEEAMINRLKQQSVWDPLRDREDFKELIAMKPLSQE